nr:MAG: ORF1 [Torque teno midi virus]UHK04755.1 MAG: ORF1 [Torque teno midi virus]UHK04762.1 MAG: ORF1 [Torque teno midi virus]
MPWWWNRRKRYYWGRFRSRRRKAYRKPRRRTTYRRRPRFRRRRRRRRRRYKVKRKKQTITVKQWQPDAITKCKIKGMGVLVLGGDGRQMYCYTDEKQTTVPPRTPMGGGFGIEVFSLKYLYDEYTFHNNIWTKTNILKDLARYLYCKFIFYRHPDVDFIISYDRQPPFTLNKLTYPSTHPHQLLQHKHKRFLLSTKTKPTGKLFKKFFIKPPKQMLTKWFFQTDLCKHALVEIRAAACDFRYSYLGCCNENQQLGLYYLDRTFYALADWGHAKSGTDSYKPRNNIGSSPYSFSGYKPNSDQKISGSVDFSTYDKSISYDSGWFQKKLLQITKFENPTQAATPINTCIYNLNLDDGVGNAIYLTSILSPNYDPPQTDSSTTIVNLPLWLGLYGLFDYIAEYKKTREFWKSHCVMLKSPALLPHPQPTGSQTILPIDPSFINGYTAFDQPPTLTDKTRWYPTMLSQINTLNAIVEAGPFIPKFAPGSKQSTWELKYFYTFAFKWGGPMLSDAEVTDPCKQGKYDVPDTMQSRLQIQNPEKIKTESILHPWDIRRGIIKEKALKRMCDNLSIDTAFEPVGEQYPPPKKKRFTAQLSAYQEEEEEILQCLRSLCNEKTQEEEEKTTSELIRLQQQEQHNLKRHILQLIAHIKENQRKIQLHTGMIQ